jgi:nicotinate-nucleotide pyrophosphorylase (carboxylating)
MNYLEELEPVVTFALREDIGDGDLTASLVPPEQTANAQVICREKAVLCGKPWFDEVFKQLDRSVEVDWQVGDGDPINEDQIVAYLHGPARSLLTGERTALNFLQTLSATATAAAKMKQFLPAGLRLKDTRKTLPGLRRAQKYAVVIGGCENHRIGLFDAFLIKENHIAACGSIKAAVDKAHATKPDCSVEVETENLDEVIEARDAGADIIMLDNFSADAIIEACKLIDGKAEIEVSGNVDIENLDPKVYAKVDYISSGALTKHCRAIDYSMRIQYVGD